MFRERKPSVRRVLPEGQYNPEVGEGVRWLDYERAAEMDAASMPEGGAFQGATTLEPCDVPELVDVPEPVDVPRTDRPGDAPPVVDLGPAALGECRVLPDAESGMAPAADARATPPPADSPAAPPANSGGTHPGNSRATSLAESQVLPHPAGSLPAPPAGPCAALPGESRAMPLSSGDGVVATSGRRSDILDAPAERIVDGDWFERPHRPPRLAESRPYGVRGGLAHPDPQVERDLIEALPLGTRFPDPRGTWIRLINGGGPADDPFRASNAADCALAVLSTWHGEPTTAAPRLPEYDRIGRPLLTGEHDSRARIERWVGQRLEYAGQGRHAYPMIARRLAGAGHGACAVIVVRWPGGGTHVWNAVNADGEVIWIDAQRGHMSVEPPYTTVTGVFCVILDRQGRPR